MTRLFRHSGEGRNPELARLLRQAARHKMTPAEIRAQRISFTYGQLMDANPRITREQVEKDHDEVYGRATETEQDQ